MYMHGWVGNHFFLTTSRSEAQTKACCKFFEREHLSQENLSLENVKLLGKSKDRSISVKQETGGHINQFFR